MPDMLVRLYDLHRYADAAPATAEGVVIRRAMPYERTPIRRWIEEHFSAGWADEFEATMGGRPSTTLLAVEAGAVVGFACYDATAKGFFGPTGVDESQRGRGVGRALLVAALAAMREDGYGYAIIGGVGPAAFYERAVGATLIEGSDPGMYRDRLAKPPAAT